MNSVGSPLLDRARSTLILVDVQERFRPVIADVAGVIANCRRLAEAAVRLGVPTLATEQYPKGLGPTVAELAELIPAEARLEKLAFSSWRCEALRARLGPVGERVLVVAGIEAHICVAQTVLEARAAGWPVHVVADAVGARQPRHVELALGRMAAGATITTTESAVFEWLGQAGTPEFKELQRLFK